MFDQRITVVGPGARPSYTGGTEDDWDNPTVVREVPFLVEIQPRTVSEDRDGGRRGLIQSGWRIVSPPGRVIVIGDNEAIRWHGHPNLLKVIGGGNDGVWHHSFLRHSELDVEAHRG